MKITAKPIFWQKHDHPSGRDLFDSDYGFYISEERAEANEDRFSASWGEFKTASFANLEDAQKWCQDTINDFIRKYAVIVTK